MRTHTHAHSRARLPTAQSPAGPAAAAPVRTPTAVRQILGHTQIQRKLQVGPVDDRFEHEADRVADEVMRMPPADRAVAPAHPTRIQRLCAECEAEDELRRRPARNGRTDAVAANAHSGGPPVVTPELEARIRSLGGGCPLPEPARAFFEPRFGHGLEQVRLHKDIRAAEAAGMAGARAFTLGNHIVFGAGEGNPVAPARDRLLAHELAHVVQQRGATLGEPRPSVVQRQPSSSALPPDPSTAPSAPGYEEAAHGPSFRVRIVAHASPRWRGARDTADAARRNLELSQQRADAVRWKVEELLANRLSAGTSVNVDVTVEHQEDTVGVEAEARGSHDTLLEAKGDRADDAQQRRRVDVIIQSSQIISGEAGASRPLLTRPTASKFWHVSVDMSGGVTAGVAGGLVKLSLTNDSSGQIMTGTVLALVGGGLNAMPFGASVSIWSDPTGFYIDDAVDFSAFDGKWVQYGSFGPSTFLGYSQAYISFVGLDTDPQFINVSGWSVGTPGFGGSGIAGTLRLDGPYPPTSLPIKDTGQIYTPYERTERGDFMHRVLFPTGDATLNDLNNDLEVAALESFLASVVGSTR